MQDQQREAAEKLLKGYYEMADEPAIVQQVHEFHLFCTYAFDAVQFRDENDKNDKNVDGTDTELLKEKRMETEVLRHFAHPTVSADLLEATRKTMRIIDAISAKDPK